MNKFLNVIYNLICLLLLALAIGCSAQNNDRLILGDWERGFLVASPVNQDVQIFIWFYEWHLFDAVLPGIHTHGPREWSGFRKSINESQTEGFMEKEGLRLDMKCVTDGAEMKLTVRNNSKHDWPEIAAIIPCFNPGPDPKRFPDYTAARNELFLDTDSAYTYIVGQEGITLLNNRSIHFNHSLRQQVEEARIDSGAFIFDNKWPTSPTDAYEGLIIRESIDGKWVAGIAWEDYLTSQGHNPWLCMHLSVRVGPLKQGGKKEIKGKIYLFQGNKEDCYKRYLADFKNK